MVCIIHNGQLIDLHGGGNLIFSQDTARRCPPFYSSSPLNCLVTCTMSVHPPQGALCSTLSETDRSGRRDTPLTACTGINNINCGGLSSPSPWPLSLPLFSLIMNKLWHCPIADRLTFQCCLSLCSMRFLFRQLPRSFFFSLSFVWNRLRHLKMQKTFRSYQEYFVSFGNVRINLTHRFIYVWHNHMLNFYGTCYLVYTVDMSMFCICLLT